MSYQLELVPDARDQLARLDKPIAQRILNKLRWLSETFESASPEPLSGGWKGLYKLRIGDYRALYTSAGPGSVSPYTTSGIEAKSTGSAKSCPGRRER